MGARGPGSLGALRSITLRCIAPGPSWKPPDLGASPHRANSRQRLNRSPYPQPTAHSDDAAGVALHDKRMGNKRSALWLIHLGAVSCGVASPGALAGVTLGNWTALSRLLAALFF